MPLAFGPHQVNAAKKRKTASAAWKDLGTSVGSLGTGCPRGYCEDPFGPVRCSASREIFSSLQGDAVRMLIAFCEIVLVRCAMSMTENPAFPTAFGHPRFASRKMRMADAAEQPDSQENGMRPTR